MPPGVNGLQPNLSLDYNSQSGNGLIGVGWNLSLAKIQRSTKHGKPKYNTSDIFELYFGGGIYKLVDIGGGEYRARDEGAFLKVSKTGNTWTVKDKEGMTYHFGLNDLAQQSSWPVNSTDIFSWHISKIIDPHGNIVSFIYVDDLNGHRISRINYAPDNHVNFEYNTGRLDTADSYRSGYLLKNRLLLTHVRSYAGTALASHGKRGQDLFRGF